LPWGSFAALACIAVALGALQHRAGVRGASGLLAALAVGIGFVGMQGYASGQARRAVAEAVQKMNAASLVLDAAVSSFPTNPLCWNFVSVESNASAASYRLRRGIVSLAPDILPVAGCPARLADRPSQTVLTPAIALLSQQHGSLDTLRKLRNENCHFAAWLRFARAPWLHDIESTDIRFGLDSGRNFTTINFADFKNTSA